MCARIVPASDLSRLPFGCSGPLDCFMFVGVEADTTDWTHGAVVGVEAESS